MATISSGKIFSFKPVASKKAKILILGSMPGKASLEAGQYYAYPRNAFWPIIMAILGKEATVSYEDKTKALVESGIALWDVLHSCERNTSLDSDIVKSTEGVNDFQDFFKRHPEIKYIFFNGAKAEECFKRKVLPDIDVNFVNKRILALKRLPSTSPANAGISWEDKKIKWEMSIKPLLLDHYD